jgi:hypothetical protein
MRSGSRAWPRGSAHPRPERPRPRPFRTRRGAPVGSSRGAAPTRISAGTRHGRRRLRPAGTNRGRNEIANAAALGRARTGAGAGGWLGTPPRHSIPSRPPRRRARRRPPQPFMRYIEQVLPSPGETGVLLATLGELYPAVTANAPRTRAWSGSRAGRGWARCSPRSPAGGGSARRGALLLRPCRCAVAPENPAAGAVGGLWAVTGRRCPSGRIRGRRSRRCRVSRIRPRRRSGCRCGGGSA